MPLALFPPLRPMPHLVSYRELSHPLPALSFSRQATVFVVNPNKIKSSKPTSSEVLRLKGASPPHLSGSSLVHPRDSVEDTRGS